MNISDNEEGSKKKKLDSFQDYNLLSIRTCNLCIFEEAII